MPVAKYKLDEKTKLYYTYVKTGFYYPDGKPKYQKLRAKTNARLDEKVKDYLANQALNLDVSKITVDEWEKQWFTSYKGSCRENTKNFYTNLYNKHIKPKVGLMRVADVKEFHLQALLTGMSKTHGAKTVKEVKSLLFGIFDKAVQNRMIPANPAGRLTAAGKQPKRRRELTKDERRSYLDACKQHGFGAFAALLYFCGLRRGEAAALLGSDITDNSISITKQHLFPHNNHPVLGPPKTAAGFREVIIPDAAREYIDFDSLRRKGDSYLFSREDGGPLTQTQIAYRWKSFMVSAFPDGTDITEHFLRHNYCVLLFEAAVDLPTVQRLMGHDNLQTTLSVYTHYSDAMKTAGEAKARRIGM